MKRSRLIAFLLTAMMLLSTAATGVFALDETGAPESAAADNGTEVVVDNPSVPADNIGTVDEEVTPAPVTGEENITDEAKQEADSVTATPSGKTVTVSWTDAEVFKIVVKQGDTEVPSEPLTDAEKAEMKKVFTLEYDTEYTFEAFKGTEEAPESVGTATAKTEVKPAPAAPTLYAYPAYHSVYLTWTPSENATKYVLYRTDGAVFDNITATSFTDTNNAADTTYSYYVVAFNGDKASANSNVASAARVRTCYYRITFKKKVKLTSHDGTKTKHTFQKGQVVYADGFSQGKYQFDFEGHRYHAKWMRIKKPSGDYATNSYENGVTPTLYVNQTGYGSPTGYLIWISLYSQRVYVFQGSAYNWTLIQDWQCGSGKAKTPTPTGMNKSLHKKMKKYSKHKWWNCFSGNNAIHGSNGQKEIRKLGRLISNGCVRVTNDQAIWIFNTVPKGTRVLVF